MRSARTLTLLAAGAATLTTTALLAAPSFAGYSSGDYGYGSYSRGSVVSYLNPDTGSATANPDVNADSSCFRPDTTDNQRFSDPGTANRNVHNDACFLSRDGQKLDGPASFQSSGVGFISACPDPDGAGPKTAVNKDTNGDGRNDLCFQSGYQQMGVAGDLEFHARMNNTGMAGRQTVVWCSDANQNGCADEYDTSTVRIDWSADGAATYSYGGYGY